MNYIHGPKPKEIKWNIDENGCWVCTSHKAQQSGYPTKWVNGKIKKNSHIMYEKFKGPIVNNLWVLHTCDNHYCINPFHLFLGTPSDNALDRENKKRGKKQNGENNDYSKLTNEIVLEIRSSQQSQLFLSKKFNISQGHISKIKRRVLWKHI